MPPEYLPLFVFGLMALALPLVTLGALRLIRPSRPNPAKAEAYECGVPAGSNARARYSVQFAVAAIVFVLFDAEAVMLFPWAVRYRSLGWFGVTEGLIFLAVLAVGYLWARQKGAFEWN